MQLYGYLRFGVCVYSVGVLVCDSSDEHSESDLGNKIDGPKQPILESYPSILIWDHQRKFNKKWFQMFPFLEYSISKNKVFCFTCKESSSGLGYNEDVFTKYGYSDWKNIKRSLIPTYGSKTT